MSFIVLAVPAFLEVNKDTDFRMIQQIAQGGMGTVWLCEILNEGLKQKTMNQVCVAKVSKGRSIDDPSFDIIAY